MREKKKKEIKFSTWPDPARLVSELSRREGLDIVVRSFSRLCILMIPDVMHARRGSCVSDGCCARGERAERAARGLGEGTVHGISNEFVVPTRERVRVICERVSSVHRRVFVPFFPFFSFFFFFFLFAKFLTGSHAREIWHVTKGGSFCFADGVALETAIILSARFPEALRLFPFLNYCMFLVDYCFGRFS